MKPKQDKKSKEVSDLMLLRLSMYYRTLDIFEHAGVKVISSQKIGDIEGIPSTQVRRDLSYFGSFGVRGFGYDVSLLKMQITRILGLDRQWKVVLIGAGHLSYVLLNSEAFKKKNFRIEKIFDKNPKLIGTKIENITVSNIDNLEEEVDPETDSLAIIALPPKDVQSVIDRLGEIGMKGVLYFAARTVAVPKNMIVRNHDISVELGMLTYRITHKIR